MKCQTSISDGEGDKEAGDVARTALHAKEEKMRHKEVLRRIRIMMEDGWCCWRR